METREPAKPDGVEEVAAPSKRETATAAWSEEERRNAVAFFTLLDQWDRELRKVKGVA